MRDKKFDRLARLALAGRERNPGPHFDLATLFRYHDDTLPAAEAERVTAHVTACPACAEAVLDFAETAQFDMQPDASPPSRADVEAGWRALEAELAPSGDTATRPRSGSAVPSGARGKARWNSLGSRTWQGALAAVVLLSLGLGAYTVALRRALSRTEGPRINVVVAELHPEELTRGSREQPVVFTRQTRHAVLLLYGPPGQPGQPSAYRLDVVSKDVPERVVWSADGLVPGNDGLASFELPRGFLPPGSYRARFGGNEYPFKVVVE